VLSGPASPASLLDGIAFIVLALLLAAAVIAQVAGEHLRESARLDRRLARVSNAVAATARPDRPATVPGKIAPLLAQAQLVVTSRTLWTLGVTLVALTVTLLVAYGPVAALAMLVIPPAGLALWVRRRAGRRVEALIDGLPFYVDTVRQLQAVGASLPQALQRGLTDSPEIVRSYMAPFARRLELGAPLGEAAQQLAERLQVAEISMLAAAIRTNQRYGGSMTAILANLARILRDGAGFRRDLRAATAEARVSAKVLVAMPLVAMALLVSLNPAYLAFFIEDPRGHRLALVALLLQGIGVVAMNRLMKVAF